MSSLGSYISFRRKALSLQGIHPPFAYEFVEQVAKSKTLQNEDSLKKLRRQLRCDHSFIEIQDLGAGSRKNSSNRRKVSEIAKVSSSRLKDLGLFQRTIGHMNHNKILELGSNLGLGTCALASCHNNPQVISIEGDKSLATIAKKSLHQLQLKAEIVHGAFEEKLIPILKRLKSVDFVYIDGNHRKEPTLRYFHALREYCHESSVLAFGDIRWSQEMKMAWNEIIAHGDVSLSMDFFHFGLIFFKTGLTKQDFTIKY